MIKLKPVKGEAEQAYISRCMSNKNVAKEYPNEDQRSSVAKATFNANPTGDLKLTLSFNKDAEKGEKRLLALRHLMSDLVEIKKLEDKDFLVVPTVMILEGVHNELLYTAEELGKIPGSWDGRPVVLTPTGHPKDKDGNDISANTPKGFEQESVGNVFNTEWIVGSNKLKAEVWIDILKCKEVEGGQELLDKLYANENIEVSTGLFTECDMVPGEWNGESYIGTVYNYRPDHLALLPNDVGACSWEDGAGMCRNKEDNNEADVKTKNIVMNALLKAGIKINELSFDEISDELRELIKARVNPGINDYVWVVKVYDKTFIYEHSTNQETNMFRQGYSIGADDKAELVGEPVEVEQKTEFVSVANQSNDKTVTGNAMDQGEATNKGGSEMNRKEQVTALIANSDWGEDDRAMLEGLNDNQYAKMTKNEETPVDEKPADEKSADEKPADEKPAEDKPADEKPADEPTDNVQTTEDVINNIEDPAIKQSIQRAVNRDAALKTKMVAKLLENKACPYTKEVLEAKNIDELENLLTLSGTAVPEEDFSGRAPAAIDTNADEASVPAMPILCDNKKKDA